MNPWVYVMIGGFVETTWAVAMKLSEGFTNIGWSLITLVLLILSVVLLNRGLSKDLPAGPAYSVWVGIGAIGSLVCGYIIFDETLTMLKLIFIMAIICGVLGIENEHSKISSATKQ